jgi:hypothetical protein
MRQCPGRVCFGSATPIEPCRDAHAPPAPPTAAGRPKEENAEDFLMTEGEIAYLTMVLVLFGAFFLVIGAVSQSQDKRRGQ